MYELRPGGCTKTCDYAHRSTRKSPCKFGDKCTDQTRCEFAHPFMIGPAAMAVQVKQTRTKRRDVVFMLDASESMGGEALRLVKQATCDFFDALRDVDRVALFTFNDSVQPLVGAVQTKRFLSRSFRGLVDSITVNAGTVLFDAVVHGMRALKRSYDLDKILCDETGDELGVPSLVLLSDGIEYGMSQHTLEEAVDAIEDSDVPVARVFFIAVGDAINQSSTLASLANEKVVLVPALQVSDIPDAVLCARDAIVDEE
jgi:uncharacterized protein YegL